MDFDQKNLGRSERRFRRRSAAASIKAGVSLGAVLLLAFGCASTSDPQQSAEELGKEKRRAQMHYDLGVQQLKDDNVPLAIRELLMAVKSEPENAAVRLALAEGYRRKGRVEETEKHLLKALEIDSEFQRARLSLSALYSNLGRFDNAREHAQILVDDATFSWPWLALTNLGWAQYKLGDSSNARQNLLVALDYREDYWPARLNLGILESEQERRREALSQFRQVLAVQPGPHAEAETHYRMAEQHIALGERDRAILHLTESANRKPSGEWGERSNEALQRLN